jgi:hypothetical protein
MTVQTQKHDLNLGRLSLTGCGMRALLNCHPTDTAAKALSRPLHYAAPWCAIILDQNRSSERALSEADER